MALSHFRWAVHHDCVELYLPYLVAKCDNAIHVVITLCHVGRWSYKKPRTVNYRYNQDKLMHRLGDILVQYGIQHDTGLLPHEWHLISSHRWAVHHDCVELYLPYLVAKCDNAIHVVITLALSHFATR
jgi:hypothetical protein